MIYGSLQLHHLTCAKLLLQQEVKYLGHLVFEDVVAADPDKIRAIQE